MQEVKDRIMSEKTESEAPLSLYPEYRIKDKAMSFQLPSKLFIWDSADESTLFLASEPSENSNDISTQLFITKEEVEWNDRLEPYIAGFLDYIRENAKGYEDEKVNYVTIDGQRLAKVEYSAFIGNQRMSILQCFVIFQSHAYMIDCKCLYENKVFWKEEFDNLIESLLFYKD